MTDVPTPTGPDIYWEKWVDASGAYTVIHVDEDGEESKKLKTADFVIEAGRAKLDKNMM